MEFVTKAQAMNATRLVHGRHLELSLSPLEQGWHKCFCTSNNLEPFFLLTENCFF